MCLSEGYARQAAGDSAGINGLEAAEKAGVPWLSAGWGGSGDGIRLVEEILRPVDPVVDIVGVDSGLTLSRHLGVSFVAWIEIDFSEEKKLDYRIIKNSEL